MDYLEPLREPPLKLDLRPARFLILKHKFLELLCLREEVLDTTGENGHADRSRPEDDPSIEHVSCRFCLSSWNFLEYTS